MTFFCQIREQVRARSVLAVWMEDHTEPCGVTSFEGSVGMRGAGSMSGSFTPGAAEITAHAVLDAVTTARAFLAVRGVGEAQQVQRGPRAQSEEAPPTRRGRSRLNSPRRLRAGGKRDTVKAMRRALEQVASRSAASATTPK